MRADDNFIEEPGIDIIAHNKYYRRGHQTFNPNGISEALSTCGGGGQHPHTIERENSRIRRLTPRECERLQGFPDDWTIKGLTQDNKEVSISDTQRYKMMGNAVTVNVIEWIGQQI